MGASTGRRFRTHPSGVEVLATSICLPTRLRQLGRMFKEEWRPRKAIGARLRRAPQEPATSTGPCSCALCRQAKPFSELVEVVGAQLGATQRQWPCGRAPRGRGQASIEPQP